MPPRAAGRGRQKKGLNGGGILATEGKVSMTHSPRLQAVPVANLREFLRKCEQSGAAAEAVAKAWKALLPPSPPTGKGMPTRGQGSQSRGRSGRLYLTGVQAEAFAPLLHDVVASLPQRLLLPHKRWLKGGGVTSLASHVRTGIGLPLTPPPGSGDPWLEELEIGGEIEGNGLALFVQAALCLTPAEPRALDAVLAEAAADLDQNPLLASSARLWLRARVRTGAPEAGNVEEARVESPWMTLARLRALANPGAGGTPITLAQLADPAAFTHLLDTAIDHADGCVAKRHSRRLPLLTNQDHLSLRDAATTARFLLNLLVLTPGRDGGAARDEQRLVLTQQFLEQERELNLFPTVRAAAQRAGFRVFRSRGAGTSPIAHVARNRLQLKLYERLRTLELTPSAAVVLKRIANVLVFDAFFGGKLPRSFPRGRRSRTNRQSSKTRGRVLARLWRRASGGRLIPELQALLRLLSGRSLPEYARTLAPGLNDVALRQFYVDLQQFEWAYGAPLRDAEPGEVATLERLDSGANLLADCWSALFRYLFVGRRRQPGRHRGFLAISRLLLDENGRARPLTDLNRGEILSLCIALGLSVNRPASEADALWVAEALYGV